MLLIDFASAFDVFLDFSKAININSMQVQPANTGGSFTKFCHKFFDCIWTVRGSFSAIRVDGLLHIIGKNSGLFFLGVG